MQWDWQLAAGRLAAVTPLLVVGTTSYFEADMVEKLKVSSQRPLVFVCGCMYARAWM